MYVAPAVEVIDLTQDFDLISMARCSGAYDRISCMS